MKKKKFIKKKKNIKVIIKEQNKENVKILEIGPGMAPQYERSIKIDSNPIYGKSDKTLKKSGFNYVPIELDINVDNIPFPNDYFDLICMRHIIEHVYYPRILDFLKEANRVLRVGGKLQIVCPNLEAAAKAYCRGDIEWFLGVERGSRRKGERGINLTDVNGPNTQTIGEKFMKLLISGGSDTYVIARRLNDPKTKQLGGLAHQWGYDFEQLSKLSDLAGFKKIARTDNKNARLELKVEMYK
jgi:SAM-dependent methyltransferase